MNWIKIVLLSITITTVSITSCKSSKTAVTQEVATAKSASDSEIDKFKLKVKRLQSSVKTGDYSSANSIVKQLNYDINREIGQTQEFMSRARLTPEAKATWDKKLKIQTNVQRKMSTLRFAVSDPRNKIINVVQTLDAFVETMN